MSEPAGHRSDQATFVHPGQDFLPTLAGGESLDATKYGTSRITGSGTGDKRGRRRRDIAAAERHSCRLADAHAEHAGRHIHERGDATGQGNVLSTLRDRKLAGGVVPGIFVETGFDGAHPEADGQMGSGFCQQALTETRGSSPGKCAVWRGQFADRVEGGSFHEVLAKTDCVIAGAQMRIDQNCRAQGAARGPLHRRQKSDRIGRYVGDFIIGPGACALERLAVVAAVEQVFDQAYGIPTDSALFAID